MQGQVIGSYQLLRRLGEGGMGVVYEAVHLQIKRQAAIKLLHPQYSQNSQLAHRFLNEAKAVNIVKHPGLVEVFEYGQLADKTAYIVMEYLAGETLKQHLERRGGAIPVPEALRWTRQIAAALAAAHTCGVVHRDLKPENVMLVADPAAEGSQRLKVLDFGIAKLAAEHGQEASPHTETGLMMGTPAYMSPEQCLGAGRVNDRADVYSLGAMLYQMTAGRVPFIADGKGALILMHMTQKPPSLRQLAPQVPEPLAALIHRMLAKKKEDRPSMTEVAALAAELESRRVPARSRRWAASGLVGLGVLAFAGSSAALLSLHKGQPVPLPSPPPVSRPVRPEAGTTGPLPGGALAARAPAGGEGPPVLPSTPTPAEQPAAPTGTAGTTGRARSDRRAEARTQPSRKAPAGLHRSGLIQRTPQFE